MSTTTTETAPESCPFCGAGKKRHLPHIAFRWFECGTMTAPAKTPRRDQTPACATAERERLTRERDEEAAKADHLCVYSTSLETANRQLTKERDDLLARVKRLEEAGHAVASALNRSWNGTKRCSDTEANGALVQWNAAKEAKL